MASVRRSNSSLSVGTAVATTSAPGIVQPDGTTITLGSGGVISSVGGTGGVTSFSGASGLIAVDANGTPFVPSLVGLSFASGTASGTLTASPQTVTLGGDLSGTGNTGTTISGTVSKIGGQAVSLGGSLTTNGQVILIGAYTATFTLGGTTVLAVPAAGTLMSSVTPFTTTYVAAGAIALTDVASVINSASAAAMTLAAGTNGQVITIISIGAGAITLGLTLNGASATPTLTQWVPYKYRYNGSTWTAWL